MDLSEIINSNSSGRIIFAAVDPAFHKHTETGGINFFPDDESLRLWRLGKNNVIYLNKLADPKCKKCNGTGNLGKRIVNNISTKKVKSLLSENLEERNLPGEALKLISVSEEFLPTMRLLINAARAELREDNRQEIVDKYSKIIKEDFELKEVVYCKCFTNNLYKQQQEILSRQKFSINQAF